MRYTIMLIRLFAPATACGCFAWVIAIAISHVAVDPIVAPIAESAKWILLLVLAGAAAFLVHAMWCYWRWETGRDLGCIRCGGLLGHEQSGRYAHFGAASRAAAPSQCNTKGR